MRAPEFDGKWYIAPIRISRSSCGKGEIKRVMESVRKDKMPLDQGAAFEALVKTAKA